MSLLSECNSVLVCKEEDIEATIGGEEVSGLYNVSIIELQLHTVMVLETT